MFRAEYETGLNRTSLHIYMDGSYEEDYQMPMLKRNRIPGILPAEGCEVEGKTRYTYEVGGYVSMKSLHEKTAVQQQEIAELVRALIEVTDVLESYMLNPDCLLLNPEYIFQKNGAWHFCYLPGAEKSLNRSFHELTEYFVKTLDYGDTNGIFLAYELHRATLQEHYDLRRIMEEYEEHEEERGQTMEEWRREQGNWGNAFSLTDEEEEYESKKNQRTDTLYEEYSIQPDTDTIREEGGTWKSWRKAARQIRKRRWGSWNDLILEEEREKGIDK